MRDEEEGAKFHVAQGTERNRGRDGEGENNVFPNAH